MSSPHGPGRPGRAGRPDKASEAANHIRAAGPCAPPRISKPRGKLTAMVKHHSSQAENFRISSPNDRTLTFGRRDSRRIEVR